MMTTKKPIEVRPRRVKVLTEAELAAQMLGPQRKRKAAVKGKRGGITQGNTNVHPQEAYEMYLRLGARRSLDLVKKEFANVGRNVSMPKLRKWCFEQRWEHKVMLDSTLGERTLRAIVKELADGPVLSDLSKATLTLEDINRFLSILSKRLEAAVQTVEIVTVQDIRVLAELLPVILNVSTSVRGELLSLIPERIAAPGNGDDVIDATEIRSPAAEEALAAVDESKSSNLPVPVPAPSAVQSAILNFRQFQKTGAA